MKIPLIVRRYAPACLATVAAVIIVLCALFAGEALGGWRYALFAAAVASAASAGLAWRRPSPEGLDFERQQLATEQEKVEKLRKDVVRFQAGAEAQLEQESFRLQKRAEELSNRLVAFHELTEFPRPTDLDVEKDHQHLDELAEKDRRVIKMLEEESRTILANIRANKYAVDGEMQTELIREDAYSLISRVAKVYAPDSENPLLETSIDQLLRSASRVCLHILVALDTLPLNVKEYNINRLYSHVRQGTKALEVYKAMSPYIPYLNSAYYLGRFAMGASPLTLAAWRVAGEVGSRGAKAVAKGYLNRQALALIHEVVRIIGFEAAAVYGGDFRHRDANWVFGAELSDMTRRFPVSRDSLSHAMKEIGTLQLRSEYDRAFLYRCIASGVSALPANAASVKWLSPAERQAVASRLEKFYKSFIHGADDQMRKTWQEDVERRLHVKLNVHAEVEKPRGARPLHDAVRSLASYLVAVKQREPEELVQLLHGRALLGRMADDHRNSLMHLLMENPPFFFEQPELDSDDELTTLYLDDLARLAAEAPPNTEAADDAMLEAAAYFRREGHETYALLTGKYREVLNERLPAASATQPPLSICRAALSLAAPDEPLRFLYGGLTLWWRRHEAPLIPVTEKLWLLGLEDRMLLLSSKASSAPLWEGGADCVCERHPGMLLDGCIVRGGKWLRDEDVPPPELHLSGVMKGQYAARFRPLLEFCS